MDMLMLKKTISKCLQDDWNIHWRSMQKNVPMTFSSTCYCKVSKQKRYPLKSFAVFSATTGFTCSVTFMSTLAKQHLIIFEYDKVTVILEWPPVEYKGLHSRSSEVGRQGQEVMDGSYGWVQKHSVWRPASGFRMEPPEAEMFLLSGKWYKSNFVHICLDFDYMICVQGEPVYRSREQIFDL